MELLKSLLENKKEDEFKPVFKETDPSEPFPNDTMSSIKKELNSKAKDLEQDWDSAVELLNKSLEDLHIPKPDLTQKKRREQYNELLGYAVEQLYDARGASGSWRINNK